MLMLMARRETGGGTLGFNLMASLDPIFNATPDPRARESLVSAYDPGLSEPEFALGYRFDIVLRGRAATPFENAR